MKIEIQRNPEKHQIRNCRRHPERVSEGRLHREADSRTAFGVLCGKRAHEGSISVYFALVLAVMVSLILTEITSAKVSAGRAQAANVMDQCMDSLFAHYDRESAELYDLFWICAGKAGVPDPSGCISFLEENSEELFSNGGLRGMVIGSPLLKLEEESAALTGYSLATDASGALFRKEASDAIKETGGERIFAEVLRRMDSGTDESEGSEYLENAEEVSFGDIDNLSRTAREASEEAGQQGNDADENPAEVPDDFVNPLPALKKIRGKSLLELVLPDGVSVSEKEADPASLVSGRALHSGIGVVDASGAGGSGTCFRAWVYTHFQNFTDPSENSVLAYQTEYILCGQKSDRENLKQIVKRLLLIREAANIVCLYRDAAMSAELETEALLIATVLMIPEASELVKLVLAAGWAYAESITDVRTLLEGKRVAAVKTSASWQTDLESIAASGGSIRGLTRDDPRGLNYKEYLGALLARAQLQTATMRAMDMTESELRGRGRPDFRLDTCMVAVTAEIRVRSENLVSFEVEREQSYLENT